MDNSNVLKCSIVPCEVITLILLKWSLLKPNLCNLSHFICCICILMVTLNLYESVSVLRGFKVISRVIYGFWGWIYECEGVQGLI